MTMNPKQAQVFSLASMVLIMTMVVVLLSNLITFGLDASLVSRFLRGWGIAFVVAFPLALILMPRLQRFYQGFVRKP